MSHPSKMVGSGFASLLFIGSRLVGRGTRLHRLCRGRRRVRPGPFFASQSKLRQQKPFFSSLLKLRKQKLLFKFEDDIRTAFLGLGCQRAGNHCHTRTVSSLIHISSFLQRIRYVWHSSSELSIRRSNFPRVAQNSFSCVSIHEWHSVYHNREQVSNVTVDSHNTNKHFFALAVSFNRWHLLPVILAPASETLMWSNYHFDIDL